MERRRGRKLFEMASVHYAHVCSMKVCTCTCMYMHVSVSMHTPALEQVERGHHSTQGGEGEGG